MKYLEINLNTGDELTLVVLVGENRHTAIGTVSEIKASYGGIGEYLKYSIVVDDRRGRIDIQDVER